MRMVFAQLNYLESLRDIECFLPTTNQKFCHMVIKANISRSTLTDVNEKLVWLIYSDFASDLIDQAPHLFTNEDFSLELKDTGFYTPLQYASMLCIICHPAKKQYQFSEIVFE